ncbi:hypothetical protein SISNIDRAFT_489801 [Sistotremastrum niveocremeum HHB9708]|uniref:Uncharacterized protein n=1 Tax=Sistotremastrum niveocremeum HHB9708 TaxID=1314777 RepID=A0A164PIS1_9AGAM|nr:hypothetical protein SISNIDRAFT_489801 [Sistotremastrum niveocremeum HHB9708]
MAGSKSKKKANKNRDKNKEKAAQQKAASQSTGPGTGGNVDASTMELLQRLVTSVGTAGPSNIAQTNRVTRSTSKAKQKVVDSGDDDSETSSSGSSDESSEEEGLNLRDMGRLAPRTTDDDDHSSARSKRSHVDSDGEVLDDDDEDGPPSPTRRKITSAAQHGVVIGPRTEVIPRTNTSTRNSQLRSQRTGASSATTTPSTISGPITPAQRTPSPVGDGPPNLEFTPFKKNRFNDSRPQ